MHTFIASIIKGPFRSMGLIQRARRCDIEGRFGIVACNVVMWDPYRTPQSGEEVAGMAVFFLKRMIFQNTNLFVDYLLAGEYFVGKLSIFVISRPLRIF